MSNTVLAAAFTAFLNCHADIDNASSFDRCLKRTMAPNVSEAEERKATEFLLLGLEIKEIGDCPKELESFLEIRQKAPTVKDLKSPKNLRHACFFERGSGKNGLSGEIEFQDDANGAPKIRRIRYTY